MSPKEYCLSRRVYSCAPICSGVNVYDLSIPFKVTVTDPFGFCLIASFIALAPSGISLNALTPAKTQQLPILFCFVSPISPSTLYFNFVFFVFTSSLYSSVMILPAVSVFFVFTFLLLLFLSASVLRTSF